MMMFLMATVGCSSSDNTPAPVTYSISGTVTGPAQTLGTVVITLTNVSTAATSTATTATDGTYSFTGLANGTYTLAPALTGYVFDPSTTVVVVNGSNMVQNFVSATTPGGTLYSISGYVYLSGTTTPLSGVTVTLAGAHTGAVITGTTGTWTFAGLPGGAGNNYTVTASLSGYSITPVVINWNAPAANSSGNIFYATVAKFSQADLAGTWVVHSLKTNTAKWFYFTGTVDVDGNVSLSSCSESGGSTTCPSGTLTWTIDPTTGVITEGGSLADTSVHMTMASNKKFFAGTSSGGGSNPAMRIAQKEVTGTSYAATDIQSKNFVFHQLTVGDDYKWEYAVGSTDSNGLVSLSTHVSSSGTDTTGTTNVTFVVDTVTIPGKVTASGDIGTFTGFLSADKKTIVGTTTDSGSGTHYSLLVIQLIDGQSSSTSAAAGNYYAHMLTVGTGSEAPFWAHQTIGIASTGVMTFDNWVCSNVSVTGPPSSTTDTMSVGTSGTATIALSPSGTTDFNGQVSFDGTFLVGTQTFNTNEFSLIVVTKLP
jgi:hypothetical protein